MRDAVRRDIEQANGSLAFASALHERLEPQRRLFADFPRVMEQLRSGALERVATALSRLFEGKDQFDLTRFLRDLPLALGQLAAAEAARKGPPKEAPSAEVAHGGGPPAAPAAGEHSDPPAQQPAGAAGGSEQLTAAEAAPAAEGASAMPEAEGASESATASAPEDSTSTPSSNATPTASATPSSNATPAASAPATPNAAPTPTTNPPAASAGNGGAPAEPPSPRLELRSRLLAAAPQLGKAVLTYRRTAATVRRAAAPRRAPGPWRSDREVLEEAKLAVDFARQLFDAYAEAWADQPTQPGNAEAMSAEMDRFLAWTQLARYMDVAAPRSQPPPVEKPAEKTADKQPVTQGTAGAGATPVDGEPAHSP